MNPDDWEFEFQASSDRFEVRITGKTNRIHSPNGPIRVVGDEAIENFRQFVTGWIDGQNERVVGSFPWARVLHAGGNSLRSPSTGAAMSRLLRWEELVMPVVALEATDWEVV